MGLTLSTLGIIMWVLMFDISGKILFANVGRNVSYYDKQASLNLISGIMTDKNDVLYCCTDGSNCLIAFDKTGKCLYSIYLPPNAGRGNTMALLGDEIVAIESGLTQDIFLFHRGILLRTMSPVNEHERGMGMAERLNHLNLSVIPAQNETYDSEGNLYRYSLLYPQIIKMNSQGRTEAVAREPLLTWIFSAPYPAFLWVVVGLVLVELSHVFLKRFKSRDGP